ncbi:hypothetical protein [Mesorhizobium sp. CA12]|uniref:hypothetical protein n=1 Tax=Mesorhizobium sp. CA12 TaxID=2876644 RepID=UPI001CCCE9BB|nr:hypothetical protein [Mesorhizobium sp. CA12]MBZ9859727.1 hypothetical protein [Mesorhizobium sp. CA12]
MDIATGLTFLGQATGIVKDLRDIDKGFDQASLKAQMADLYGTLADVKIALSDARETIHEQEQQIKRLEERVATFLSGDACPICDGGRLKVASSRPHEHFGWAGKQMRTLKCDKCGHSEERMFTPPNGQ